MGGPSLWRQHWPALLALGVFGLVGLGALALPGGTALRATAIALWGVVPLSVAIATYAYARFDRYRLFVNRLRFRVLNPESTWGLTAEFQVADPAVWEQVEGALDAELQPGERKMARTDGNAVWNARGLVVQVSATVAGDPIEGDVALVRVEIPPITRPYRTWWRVIERDAAPLVARIERSLQAQDCKFVVRLAFPGDNPYFGLFVSGVGRSAVARFDIEFFEQSAGERDRVRVREGGVEVVTGTLLAAQTLSLRYLTLTADPRAAG